MRNSSFDELSIWRSYNNSIQADASFVNEFETSDRHIEIIFGDDGKGMDISNTVFL